MTEPNAQPRPGESGALERVVYYGPPPPYEPDDEIDLRELFSRLWNAKWLIAAVTAAVTAAAVTVALLLPNQYEASALLAPNAREQDGMMNRLSQRFGGLASMAGVDLPQGEGVSPTVLAMETLQSRAFLTDFIRRHELEVPLLAAQGWDEETGEWLIDREIYDPESGEWVREVEPGRSPEPTDWELYKAMSEQVLSVEQSQESGLVTVSVELTSPVAAKRWVDWLVAELNAHMREQAIREAEESISYLRDQAEGTPLAEMRSVFFSLIEQQTQRRMLAEVRDEFAFKTVDPAVVPEELASPNRPLIAVLGMVLGGMLGVFVALVRGAYRSERTAG